MPNKPTILSNEEREARRMQAWNFHQLGWSQHRIARSLGVSQSAVSQWLKKVRDGGGVGALRYHPALGRQALLTDEQFAQLPSVLARGAESFGFVDNQWTTKRVAIVLQQLYGVSYHPGHVCRILKEHCSDWRKLGRG